MVLRYDPSYGYRDYSDDESYTTTTSMGFSDNDPRVRQSERDARATARSVYESNKKSADIAKSTMSGANMPFELTGSPEQRAGAAEGLQFGQILYGQGIGDVGREAADYSSMVKGRLGADYAGADIYRQEAGQRIAQANAKAGLSGVDTAGATEQLRRKSSMEAAAMNQDYKDKAMALYGRNISAKQQGLAGQYMAGKGVGNAATPAPTVAYSSGGFLGSVICTELYRQGKITKIEYCKASIFGYSIHPNTYFGYLTIATPIVSLMKRSDKFSNLFIGWAKSIAKNKPNLITRILIPVCWVVGYVRKTKEKEITRIA